MQCPKCQYKHNNIKSLFSHCVKKHDYSSKELYMELFCKGKIPTCECGCGQETKFISISKGFSKYRQGHKLKENNFLTNNYKRIENLRKKCKENAKGKQKEICQNCNKEFEGWPSVFKQGRKFCSKKCANEDFRLIDGYSRKKLKETLKEKYGFEVSNVMKIPEIAEKAKNILSSKEVQDKIKDTNNKKYGVDNVFSSPVIQNKIKNTNLETFGVEYPQMSDEIKEKTRQNNIEKYGVGNPFQLEEIKEKFLHTMQKKYGVVNPSQIPGRNEKIDWEQTFIKQHETKKKNGSYKKSKAEDEFHSYLLKWFPEKIERQKLFNNWPIDFYLTETQVYIQFDGIYWHALNEDNETLKNSTNPRDVSRLLHKLNDQKQNEQFTQNKMKLYRISDIKFKENMDTDFIYKDILKFSSSRENIKIFH